MKTETLENLLIDRALGALSPDMEALLGEYLTTHADGARLEGELRDTVSLAAIALKRLPDHVSPRPTIITMPRRERLNHVLAMAASFVVGATAVFIAMRGANDSPRSVVLTPAKTSREASTTSRSSDVTTIDPAARTLPFWSKERASLFAKTARTSTHREDLR